MKLFDAYVQVLEEEDDPLERENLSSCPELKEMMVEEIVEAFKEIKTNKESTKDAINAIGPIFKCVAFFFIIGIRVGKVLRDKELAEVK